MDLNRINIVRWVYFDVMVVEYDIPFSTQPFTTQSRLLMTPEKEALGKHCGKRRKCWLPAFPLFQQCFLLLKKTKKKQEGHDGPVSLHWLIREIHSYQTLHYLGIGLKHKTPYKD